MILKNGIKEHVKSGKVTAHDSLEVLRMRATLNDGNTRFLEQTRTYRWLVRVRKLEA